MTTAAKAKLIAAIVIVVLLFVVFLQNGEEVEFRFLFFGAIRITKTLLILGSMLVGAVLTLLVQIFLRQRKRVRAAEHSALNPPH